MKTSWTKPSEIKQEWMYIDAEGMTVGRLSSQIAHVLRGKHKVSYVPNLDTGDGVIVLNAAKVKFTGNKWKQKTYFWHTGYIGGIKAARAEEVLAKHPERILEHAIKGMMPKTKLAKEQIKKLKIYSGSEHPHAGQAPVPLISRLNTEAK